MATFSATPKPRFGAHRLLRRAHASDTREDSICLTVRLTSFPRRVACGRDRQQRSPMKPRVAIGPGNLAPPAFSLKGRSRLQQSIPIPTEIMASPRSSVQLPHRPVIHQQRVPCKPSSGPGKPAGRSAVRAPIDGLLRRSPRQVPQGLCLAARGGGRKEAISQASAASSTLLGNAATMTNAMTRPPAVIRTDRWPCARQFRVGTEFRI